ncbi:MAG: hypothetical protein AAF253_02760 [Pseudomonadota bacterium]
MADRPPNDIDDFLFSDSADAPSTADNAAPITVTASPLANSLVPPAIAQMPEIDFNDLIPTSVAMPAPTRIQLDILSRALVDAATLTEENPAPTEPSPTPAMERVELAPTVETAPATAAEDSGTQSAFSDTPSVELTRSITDVGFTSQKVLAGESRTGVTTVDFGADGNLYSGDIFGNIVRYTIDPATGLATNAETIINVGGPITGLKFDPDSPADGLDLWIAYATTNGRYSSVVSEISVPANGQATEQRKITGLPYGDHQVNGLDFGPDGRLYIQAGGLASLGEFAPGAFADPEVPLSAALLVADVNGDPRFAGGPINVQANENGQGYDPDAPNAPVQIYATGLRNAYDIEWTRNDAGQAVAVAGVNGNSLDQAQTPDDPSTPQNENFFGIKPAEQFVVIEEGGYYGHPNPSRGEYILNGGNPTGGNDPWQVGRYAVGTQPEPGFNPNRILNVDNFGADSPNGADTYIDGTILQTTFSGDRKILLMGVDANTRPVYLGDIENPNGGDITFTSPLDIVTDPNTGRIYVANFGQRQSDPSNGAVFVLTPEAGAVRETGGGPQPVDPPAPTPTPTPAPPPPPAPIPAPPPTEIDGPQRIESEAFQNRNNVEPADFAAASGGQVIALADGAREGSVEARFSGENGAYDVTVGYFDAPGAGGTISVFVNEVAIGTIPLNRGGTTATTPLETVFEGVELDPGNTLRFELATAAGEPGRLDYIELAAADVGPTPQPTPSPIPAPTPTPVPVPTPTPDSAPDPTPDPTPPTGEQGRASVWREGFDGLADGARVDTGDTAWTTTTTATTTAPLFGVERGAMVFSDATQAVNEDNAFHTWRSEAIDVSGLSDVEIGFSLFSSDGLEASGEARDFFRVYAIVDGTRMELLARDGGPANTTQAVTLDGVPSGERLVIEVEAKTTFDSEAYRLDNVEVTGVQSGGAPSPVPAPQPIAQPLPISQPIGPTDGPTPDMADQVHHDFTSLGRVDVDRLAALLETADTFDFGGLFGDVADRLAARLEWQADWDPFNGVTGLDLDDFTEIA